MTRLKFTNKTFLELIVLTMISVRQYSANEILSKLGSIDFVVPKGSLHPLLAKLKLQNLVTTQFEEMDIGPAQKCFYLTENGQRRLKELKIEWRNMERLIYKVSQKTF